MLTQENYTISRADLKDTLRTLVQSQKKISAIRLVRSVTGWGLKESKDYVESDMEDTYPVGAKVQTTWGEKCIVQGVNPRTSGTQYWLVDERGEACTYSQSDIKSLAV
jgi:hypothetical protein